MQDRMALVLHMTLCRGYLRYMTARRSVQL